MKRRFFYYFSIIPRNFIIFNFVFNSTKINDPFRKLADANCRAPDRTDNARWGCTKIIKLSFIFLSPLVYRSYHCYYIYSNNQFVILKRCIKDHRQMIEDVNVCNSGRFGEQLSIFAIQSTNARVTRLEPADAGNV